MNVYMINSGYDGCNYVRIIMPARSNGFRSNKMTLYSKPESPRNMQANLRQANVVVFHRPETEEFYNLAKLLKADGKKIVVDNDDTFKLDDYYKLAEVTCDGIGIKLKDRAEAMDKMLGIADLVTTSTEFLAREYKKINKNTIVIPNCIDTKDWDKPLRSTNKKVRVGMVGSVSYEYDYLHIKDVIRQLGERKDVEFVLFGLGDKKHRKDNPKTSKIWKDEYKFWDSIDKEQVQWCPIYDYQETLNETRLDMMLIPRKDNYFNRCKSNVKFLEAAMLEIPVIAQSFDNGPYEEIEYGKTGMLIYDNSDWLKTIDTLIKDKKLRRQIGKNAKQYALNSYNIKNLSHLWEDAYRKL